MLFRFALLLSVLLLHWGGVLLLLSVSKERQSERIQFSAQPLQISAKLIPFSKSDLGRALQKRGEESDAIVEDYFKTQRERREMLSLQVQQKRALLRQKEVDQRRAEELKAPSKRRLQPEGERKRGENQQVAEAQKGKERKITDSFNRSAFVKGVMQQLKPLIQHCYPELSRRRGEEGRVELTLELRAKGDFYLSLRRSSGFSRLDRCAIEAITDALNHPTFKAEREQFEHSVTLPLPAIEFRLQ